MLSPLWVALVASLLMLLPAIRARRAWRKLLLAVSAMCWLLMTPLGANLFAAGFAKAFSAPPCPAPLPDTIVVLGGGFDRAPDSPSDYAVFLPGTYDRLIAGIELQQEAPDRRLVLVGGGDFATSEAAVMATFARRFGVAADRITVEPRSRSTWENAELARAIEPRLPERVVLVSSAVHLPRAQYAFRLQGFDVCPYAADRLYIAPKSIGVLMPQRTALQKTDSVLHEIAGLVAYRARRWREGAPATP